MSGPWDNYAQAQPAQAGPWAQYGTQGGDRYAQLHAQLSALPPEQRSAAVAALSPQDQQVLQQGQQAVAQAAMSPQAQAQRFQQAQAQNVGDMGTLGRLWAGVGEGAQNFWNGVKQNTYDRAADLVDGGNRVAQDEANVADQRGLSQALNSTTAGTIGNVVGGAMSASPLMLVPGGGESAMARLGLSAGTGALAGYLSPYASEGEHVANTAIGAATGPIATGIGKLGKFALAGAATPEAQRMLAAGVKLTPGQMLGGVANRTEQALTSLPITGDAIGVARNNAMDTFNHAAINKALAPIGATVPKEVEAGQPALAWAAQQASDAYDNALSNSGGKLDMGLVRDLGAIAAKSDPSVQGEVQSVIRNDVLTPFAQNNGSITGQQYQNLVSDLKQARRGYMTKQGQTSGDRQLAKAYGQVINSLDGMFSRVNGPEALSQLNNANTAYKGFSTLRDATAAAGRTREGVFTPGEFLGAIKKGDATKAKGNFAKGQAFMQQFGNDAQNTVGNTIGNSFTFDRFARSHLGGLAGGLAASPLAVPYLPGVRRAAQAVIAPQIGPVRGGLLSLAGQLGGYGQSRFLPMVIGAENGRIATTPPVTPLLPAPAAFRGN